MTEHTDAGIHTHPRFEIEPPTCPGPLALPLPPDIFAGLTEREHRHVLRIQLHYAREAALAAARSYDSILAALPAKTNGEHTQPPSHDPNCPPP